MQPTWNDTLTAHLDVLAALRDAGPLLDAVADALLGVFRAGGRLYLFGNGGSAADAQHIAGELLGRFRRERAALPALALTTDTSTLTAVANDYSFERIFARQLEGLLRPGDAVWALSTSGNSANVVAALRVAAPCATVRIGFGGETGGQMAALCTHVFKVPHTRSDRIQEAHMLAYHYVCERVEAGLA